MGPTRLALQHGCSSYPQLVTLHEHLQDVLDSSVHDGDRRRGRCAPKLRDSEKARRSNNSRRSSTSGDRRTGPLTDDGNERWPVCRVTSTVTQPCAI